MNINIVGFSSKMADNFLNKQDPSNAAATPDSIGLPTT